MSRRKPLPYAAGQLVDLATMELSDAMRAIRPLLTEQQMTETEQIRRIAQTVFFISRASEALQQIRQIQTND